MRGSLGVQLSRPVDVRPRILERDVFDAGRRVLVADRVTMAGSSFRPAPSSWVMAGARIDDDHDPQGIALAVMYHGGFGRWCLCREYMSIQKATRYTPGPLNNLLAEFQELTCTELPPIIYTERGLPPYNALTGQPIGLQF